MPVQRIFPQEIFDIIIDHLHEDLDALTQCRLVCKSWLPSASFHRFYRLSCPPRNNGPYIPTAEEDGCYGLWLSRLSSMPRIPPYVRKLLLTFGNQCEGDPNIDTVDIPVLMRVVDSLPSLHTVRFFECVPKHGTCSTGFPRTRTLKEVELIFTIDSNPGYFQGAMEFFAAFPRISAVTINLLVIQAESQDQCIVPKVHPLVEVDELSLVIFDDYDDNTYSFVLESLAAVLDLERLRALTFPPIDCTYPLDFALDVTPNISELTYAANAVTSPIGLSDLRLSSFHIAGRFYITDSDEYISGWPFIARDLQVLHRASLRRITVALYVAHPHVWSMLPTYETKILEHISPPSWAPIAHFLQSCPLLDLFRVKIAYFKSVGPAADGRGWVAHFYNELRDALPTHFVDEKVEVVVERSSNEWAGPDFIELVDNIA